eukprot:2893332-Pleurochrysis_carterae.AAC.2
MQLNRLHCSFAGQQMNGNTNAVDARVNSAASSQTVRFSCNRKERSALQSERASPSRQRAKSIMAEVGQSKQAAREVNHGRGGFRACVRRGRARVDGSQFEHVSHWIRPDRDPKEEGRTAGPQKERAAFRPCALRVLRCQGGGVSAGATWNVIRWRCARKA